MTNYEGWNKVKQNLEGQKEKKSTQKFILNKIFYKNKGEMKIFSKLKVEKFQRQHRHLNLKKVSSGLMKRAVFLKTIDSLKQI